MKNLNIVSKVVARKGEALASPSKDASTVNLSDFLLKSIWDKVFEFRTDSQGIEYIFGKIPVVTQYGITMYSGDGVDVPSLASGLPFDGRTIWYNPDTQQIEVIGGTGGGSGEGVSNFWDLSGIPSWITNTKPKYTYSEIEGTPDLSKYALASQIPSLSGYATESWVLQKNYATKATTLSGYGITDAYTKTNVDDLLLAYVTLGGRQTITGEKNFTGGLKVNGSPIVYDATNKYWKFEGDLLVTGGVTMYGSDSSFTPSTIMDAIAVDGTTISKSGGVLKVIGGTGGGLDITALQNYLTQNSYLNVTSGDNRYLQLSGGTLTLENGDSFKIKRNKSNSYGAYIAYETNDGMLGKLGMYRDDIEVYFGSQTTKSHRLLHEGNYSNYALPLSGGEISSTSMSPLTINTSKQMIELRLKSNSSIKAYIGWNTTDGVFLQEGENTAYIGVQPNKTPYYFNGTRYTLWHEGNFTPSSYLPLSGGTLSGNLTIQNKTVDVITLYRDDVNNSPSIKCTNKSDGTLGYIGVSGSGSGIGIQPFFMDSAGTVNKIWHSGNDGSGSGLDADLLDGYHAMDFTKTINRSVDDFLNFTNKARFQAAYLSGQGDFCSLVIPTWASNREGNWYLSELRFAIGGNPKIRMSHNGSVTSDWREFAFTDSNVASATKLQTARTIWGQSFDGTGNVYGALSNVTALKIDDTYGVWKGSSFTTALTTTDLAYNATKHIFYTGNVGIGTSIPSYKLHVEGTMYGDLKMKTPRTIWGQSFDGTSDVNGNILLGVGSDYVIGTGYASSDKRTFNNITIGNSTNGIVYNGGTWTGSTSFNAHTFITGASSNALVINNGGNVGIGTESPLSKCDINGLLSVRLESSSAKQSSINLLNTSSDLWQLSARYGTSDNGNFNIYYYNGSTWVNPISINKNGNLLVTGGITMYSDQRKKTILNHVELSLKQIAEAPLIEHYYNGDDKKTTHVGSIAQYWANMNDWFCKLDSEGYYTMEIQNAALASAISIARELDRYETKTDKAIKKLKKRICELEEEVERLKSA